MGQFWDYIEREVPKRNWDQSNSAVNEQPESETKRQCMEQAWTMPGLSLSDSYPFTSSLTPMSQFGDSEVYLQQDDIWTGFQDEQPISNIGSMDIFNLAREQSQIEFSLDPVEQPSDSFLQAPETPGVGQFFPTPDSGCNDPDVQTETISILGAHPEKNLTSQNLHTKPYDVCFGMVIVGASCHSLPKETEGLISVNVQVLGDVLKFYGGKSNNNVGILSSPVLGKLAREFNVTFSAKCEKPKEDKDRRHSLGHKDTLMQIVIYGLCKDIDAVESILSEGNLFLQHPTQRDTSVPYENPQFLIGPGTEMPQIEDLASESISTLTTLEQSLDKKWVSEVFQTFDAVDGPATFAPVEPSPRLQTGLKEHQIKALAMMTEKERGMLEGADFPCLWEILRDFDGNVRYRHTITGITQNTRPQPFAGGILADEMGLGKTLSVLALIAWYLDSLTLEKTGPSSTLIITTLSTIPGWQQQISRHFWPGQIRTVVFHGQNRHNLSKELRNNDIVITTYDTLRSEWLSGSANSVLFSNSEGWARVVLDEAHHIRSRSSQVFQAVCEIRARYRWCLTGTPIQNSLDDYAALISFVGVPPFTGPFGKTSFAEWVSTPIHSSDRHTLGIQRLRKLVAATCLRRTKNHIQDQLKLPPRVEKIEFVELGPEERSLYDFFKTRASSLVVGKFTQRSETDKARWGTMLSLIGFLRLICNHGEQLLPAAAIELWNNQNVSPVDFHCDGTDFDLERFEVSPIDDTSNLPLISTLPNEVMEADYRPSSKVNTLLRNLQNEQRGNQSLSEAPVKSVIFSFWTKMLDLLEVALRAKNFVFQRIDGKTPLDKRSMALKRFNEDSSCTVMLASIGSVAEGVDLTAASCVHLVEPQWNPMVEAQAVDRVHRIGQIHDVTITRYIVGESIEKYVQQIQQAKQKLVQQSFGDGIPDQSALSETRFQKLLELLA